MEKLSKRIPGYKKAYKIQFWVWTVASVMITATAIFSACVSNWAAASAQFAAAALMVYCAFESKGKYGTVELIDTMAHIINVKDRTLEVQERTITTISETSKLKEKLVETITERCNLIEEQNKSYEDLLRLFVSVYLDDNAVVRQQHMHELFIAIRDHIERLNKFRAENPLPAKEEENKE